MIEMKEKIRILNMEILNTQMEPLLQEFTSGCLFTLNIDHAVMLQRDEEFYKGYCAAEFRVLDSQVIYLLWKLRRRSFLAKISGADFFPLYYQYHKDNEFVRLFVLGGIDDVANSVEERINREAGRRMVVGSYSPPDDFESIPGENEKIVSMINATDANVLVVGLGTPKQEKWIFRHRNELQNVTSFMGIGATLDFLAGKKKRAPEWMQKAALEWMYRMFQDPRRLFKRYLIRDIKFFYYFIREILGVYNNPFKEY